jgi:RNA polymerase sigma-70 factor, ECF subfamily
MNSPATASQYGNVRTAETPMREHGLVAAVCAGDEAAFERLIAPHRGEIHALCYRMLGSLQDAEDASQEAFLRAWRAIDRFEGSAAS